jgi:hypothetical protein
VPPAGSLHAVRIVGPRATVGKPASYRGGFVRFVRDIGRATRSAMLATIVTIEPTPRSAARCSPRIARRARRAS